VITRSQVWVCTAEYDLGQTLIHTLASFSPSTITWYQPLQPEAIHAAHPITGWLRLSYDSQISAGPCHLPGCSYLHDNTGHKVHIKLLHSPIHSIGQSVAARLTGHVTTGLWQRHISRLTKLHGLQAAVCLERCSTSDLETEVRERNATSLQPALVARTTACRVQTVGSRLHKNLALQYLCDELRRVVYTDHRVNSAVNRGERAFRIAASRIWNSLPLIHHLYRLSRRGWSRFCSASFQSEFVVP